MPSRRSRWSPCDEGKLTLDRFSRIQAARDTRLSKLQRGNWGVFKVNDDGTELQVERDLPERVADKIAGQKRDTMADSDLDGGWNYVSRQQERLTNRRAVLTTKVDAAPKGTNLQTEPAADQEATHRT